MRGVAAELLQLVAEDLHAFSERGSTRRARAHPTIAERSSTANRIGVIASEPDRRVRFLHGLEHHAGVVETINAAFVVDLRLSPDRLDYLHTLAETAHPVLHRHLKFSVVV